MITKEQIFKGEDEFVFRAKCRNDFIFFSTRVLGYDFSDYHKEVSRLLFKYRYLSIILPRGHSKTTMVSICYSIWRAWRGDGRIGLVSSALGQSLKNSEIISEHFSSNELLREIMPKDQSLSWSMTKMKFTNGSSITVFPFNPSARGYHHNYLIPDDIIREKDTSQEEIKDKFWNILFPTVQTLKGQIVLVGTPIADNDLLHEIEAKNREKDSMWKAVRKAAVITKPDGTWDKPLWPEQFTLDELRKTKENMGDYRFNKEYMCVVRSDATAFFPYSMILNAVDPTLGFSEKTEGEVYIGADFAMSSGSRADYSVYTVVDSVPGIYEKTIKQKDASGEWVTMKVPVENPAIIRRMERLKGVGFQAQVARLETLCNIYKPTRLIVDSSNFGRAFVAELRQRGLPVSEQDFSYQNRNTLLVQLRKMFEPQNSEQPWNGRIVIPGKTEASMAGKMAEILLQELPAMEEGETATGIKSIKSTTSHDDSVFGLCLAVRDIASPRHFVSAFMAGDPE